VSRAYYQVENDYSLRRGVTTSSGHEVQLASQHNSRRRHHQLDNNEAF